MDAELLKELRARLKFNVVYLASANKPRLARHIRLTQSYAGNRIARLPGDLLCGAARVTDGWAMEPEGVPSCAMCIKRARQILGPNPGPIRRGMFGFSHPGDVYPYRKA